MAEETEKLNSQQIIQAVIDGLSAALTDADRTIEFNSSYEIRSKVGELLTGALRNEASREAVNIAIQKTVQALPEKMLGSIFSTSGMCVQSETNKALDKLIAEVVLEDQENFKAWIREHLQKNMQTYAVQALVTLFLAQISKEADHTLKAMVGGVDMAITNAFATARMNRGY